MSDAIVGNDLRVDESRNVDDYQCRTAAAKAMAKASPEVLATWLRSFRDGKPYWEAQFGGYELRPGWGDNPDDVAARKANWKSPSGYRYRSTLQRLAHVDRSLRDRFFYGVGNPEEPYSRVGICFAFSSGVPALGSRILKGTQSTSSSFNVMASSILCSIDSPRPIIPPEQVERPALFAARTVSMSS